MKETILDVLLFLFEHYLYENPASVRDRESLQSGLTQAGFDPVEIVKAFDWLDSLADQRLCIAARYGGTVAGPMRIYAEAECTRLDTECRGFLMFLDRQGVLDANQRELVVDRLMALDEPELDLNDVKWVVLMVLFNQPGTEAAFAWIENQIFDDAGEPLH